MSFLSIFLIIIVLNYGLTFLLAQFIASTVLISMIVDLAIAFIYPIFMLPPHQRRYFYKSQAYYRMAGIFAIIFLVTTAVFEVLF